MRNLAEINLNEGGDPVDRPQPTRDQIAYLEDLVGATLPPAYIELLKFSNGGHPEYDTFRFTTNGQVEEWGISRFHHLSDSEDDPGGVIWNYRHRWPGAGRTMLPIADDGVGNEIYLDLSENEREEVVIWCHDPSDTAVIRTGLSFEQMIDALELNPDYI